MRSIGVDLHTTQLETCSLSDEQKEEIKSYKLEEIEKFTAQLEPDDQIAVEATGNSSWFVKQVKQRVKRVVVVNPRQFEVIKKSCKKTDRNDAIALARFLQANMLPEVRHKSEECQRVQSLNETRQKLVRLKTSFLNKIHALSVSRGRKLKKESLSSEKGLKKVLEEQWSESERVELEIIIEQIGSLKESIKKVNKAIEEESEKIE